MRTAPAERLQRQREGDVVVWTIDRPDVRNAIDLATFDALDAAIADAQDDRTLRAVVLTGAGPTFVSGGDLRELRTATTAADARRVSERGRRVCDGIGALCVPVIAALPGPAVGGGAEIAMACDLRVAESRAKLSFKQARMGVTTAWGVLPRLVALVGPGTAGRLLLAGHDIDAHEALRVGLVDALCSDGESVATAIAWARDMAKGAPEAIASLKAMLREAILPPAAEVRRRRAGELAQFVAAWAGGDHHEAVEAFFDGRAPVWRSRAAPPRTR